MWDSIKRYFLVRAINANKHSSATNPSKKIIFLLDETSKIDIKTILKYKQELIQQAWDVTTVSFTSSPVEENLAKHIYYHAKEIQFSGNIKSKDLTELLKYNYSFLICFANNNTLHFEYLVRSIKAKIKIASSELGLDPYIDLSLSSHKQSDIKQYIQHISQLVDTLNTK